MNRSRKRLASDVERFVQQVGRKKPKRGEPNDRHYDRRVEHLVKHMDPWELDALMRGEDEEIKIDSAFADEVDADERTED